MSRAEQDQIARALLIQRKKKGFARSKGVHELRICRKDAPFGCVASPIEQQVRLIQLSYRLQKKIDALWTVRLAIELRLNPMLLPQIARLSHHCLAIQLIRSVSNWAEARIARSKPEQQHRGQH